MLLPSIVLVKGCCLSARPLPSHPLRDGSRGSRLPSISAIAFTTATSRKDTAIVSRTARPAASRAASTHRSAMRLITGALEPTCTAARECAGPALAITLLGSLTQVAPTSAPPDWPEDFPTVPGARRDPFHRWDRSESD